MVALLVATIATMAALIAIDRSLRNEITPLGVISYELCAWTDSCQAATDAYRSARLAAGASIGLDYLFMPLYAATLAAALIFVAARRDERARPIAAGLAWAVFVAGALDGIENVALYRMLATESATPLLGWTATLCATVKLVLVAIGLLALGALALLPRVEAE
jgi:hypothetical protein